jgi:hypothetical protein
MRTVFIRWRLSGPMYNVPYDVGLGETPRFRDPYQITITVLAATARGYVVRVTKGRVAR